VDLGIDKVGNTGLGGIGGLDNLNSNKKKMNVDFSKILSKAVEQVNELQHEASKMQEDFAAGKIDNVHEVLIAAEKADISLRLTTEIRNKIVEAYKEIMRMQI